MVDDDTGQSPRTHPLPVGTEAEHTAPHDWATRAEGARPALAEAREALGAARALLTTDPPPVTVPPAALTQLLRATERIVTVLAHVFDSEESAVPPPVPTSTAQTEDYWAARWRA